MANRIATQKIVQNRGGALQELARAGVPAVSPQQYRQWASAQLEVNRIKQLQNAFRDYSTNANYNPVNHPAFIRRAMPTRSPLSASTYGATPPPTAAELTKAQFGYHPAQLGKPAIPPTPAMPAAPAMPTPPTMSPPMLKQSSIGIGPHIDHPMYSAKPAATATGAGPMAFPKAPPTMSGFGKQFGDLLGQMRPPPRPTAPSPTTATPGGGGWWGGAKQFAGNALGFAGSMLHPDNLLHPTTGMAPWALSKAMPKGPGAVGNAWNLARPAVAPAWNAMQPSLSKAPLVGRFMPGAMGAGAAPATAFGMGAAGTAGLAGYGAYAIGDLPYAGYQVATGQANLRERAADQLNAEGPWYSRYAQNVGGNLMRPGMATLDLLSSPAGALGAGTELMRGRSLDARLAESRKRYGTQ